MKATVLLITGLLAIPPQGLPVLASKLEAAGYRTILIHCGMPSPRAAIAIGHSCGADQALRSGAPLIITLDSTILAGACPKGSYCLNYYTRGHPAAGFRVARASNIRVNSNHVFLAVDIQPRIMRVLGEQVMR